MNFAPTSGIWAEKWSERGDLNPGPLPPQDSARSSHVVDLFILSLNQPIKIDAIRSRPFTIGPQKGGRTSGHG
jgi:hypothetical protein